MNVSLEDVYHYTNYISNSLGRLSQQEEETMNDNLNTKSNAEFKPIPLTDADLQLLLAVKVATADGKPIEGEVLGPVDDTYYVTDAAETADEATPTLH